MSTQLVKGANASLTDASPLLRVIEVRMSWPAAVDALVTVALLGADHRLPRDDHVLPAHLLGGQHGLSPGGELSRGGEVLEIDLTAVPSHLSAMAFLVSTPDLHRPGPAGLTELDPAQVLISDAVTGIELARYDLEVHSAAETSLVFAEVYRRTGQWKVRAVGQGSTEGLTAVLRGYGGTDRPVAGAPATGVQTSFLRRRVPASFTTADPRPRPADPRTSAAQVSLDKEPLVKEPLYKESLDLDASPATPDATAGAALGGQPGWTPPDLLTPPTVLMARTILNARRPSIRVAPSELGGTEVALTLTWVRLTHRAAPSPDVRPSTDLHLGALWQLSSGLSGAVQSLGGHLRGPVRGQTMLRLGPRSEAEGETVTIDLQRLADLHRVVLFVYAYSGRPAWQLLRPAITATWANGAKVEARIDEAPPVATICAAVSIHRVARTLVVRREAEFLRGQQSAVATAYGFDLGWSRGQVMPGR